MVWSDRVIVLFLLLYLLDITDFMSNDRDISGSIDLIGSVTYSSNPNTIDCSTPCTGTMYDDIIIGSLNSEVILGLNGNDNIQGNGGNDTIFGGNGEDIISGGSGFDKLFGEEENDVLIGDSTTSLVDSLIGNDLAAIDALYDILLGTNSITSLTSDMQLANDGHKNGTDEKDFVVNDKTGNAFQFVGIQLLDGGKGDDYLLGQNSDELFIGGPGHDYFDCGEGIDTVLDFADEDTANINCELLE